MALTDGDIISNVRTLLFDSGAVRWPDAEIRFWLNDGQRIISALRIDSCTETRVITLAAGVKQTIPTDTWLLLDIIRNVPASGGSIGRGIRLCELETLSAYSPTWPSDTAALTVDNYCYDERRPAIFYVYPPVSSSATVNVEAVLAVTPPTTTGTSSLLSIGDQYSPMLIDYILWRCFAKDAGLPNGMARAQMFMQSFYQGIQAGTMTMLKGSPNTATEGGVTPKTMRGAV